MSVHPHKILSADHLYEDNEKIERPMKMQKVYFYYSKCLHNTAKPPVAIILGGDITLNVFRFHCLIVSKT